MTMLKRLLAILLIASPATGLAQDRAAIGAAVNDNPYRTPEQVARDKHRHPVETLTFFGLEPDMTVAEVLPGWYTEILGHVLEGRGTYFAINLPPDPHGDPERFRRMHAWRDGFIASKGELFSDRAFTRFLLSDVGFAAPESVDMVLMFRAFHGWVYSGKVDEALAEIYRVLKPGGVLGVVQHRERPDAEYTAYDRRGYLKQRFVIDVARNAGFELAETSEINANSDDTKDYEIGVWALPPTLAVDDPELQRKHRAIGESDRMTLKFVKPAGEKQTPQEPR